MTLRARIAVLAAASVSIAVVGAAVAAFVLTRSELREQIDESLLGIAGPRGRAAPQRLEPRADQPPELQVFAQFLASDGSIVLRLEGSPRLPVSSADVAVARGRRAAFFRDVTVDGVHLRMLTTEVRMPPRRTALTEGRRVAAAQYARSLAEVDDALDALRIVLALVATGGVALAAGLGVLVARNALRPVADLTEAAERVAETQDLRQAIDVDRGDELGRLADSFNAMLAALERSRSQQRQLVADASHELRTPLTSLRTNIDLLLRADDLPSGERDRTLADVRTELEELTHLVAELVELATDPTASQEEAADVRLDQIVEHVAARARRRTTHRIVVDADVVVVHGRPSLLERAVTNLVDNACKWGPPGEPIDVSVRRRDGSIRVAVRDRGPGIDAADRTRVFDRFYRAPAARAMPGSGLGLAIAREAVQAHGGEVFVEETDVGACVVFELPDAVDDAPRAT